MQVRSINRALAFSAILLAACALLLPNFSQAQDASKGEARIISIDRDPVSGTIEGVDLQKRLLVREPGADFTVSVALDGIEEVDFGRKAEAPSKTDAPFRVVLTDGTILYGDFASLSQPEIFTITSDTFGELEIDVFYVERVERRAVSEPGEAVAPSLEDTDDEPLFRIYTATGESPLGELYELADEGPMLFLEGISEDSGEWWKWYRVKAIVRRPLDKEDVDEFTTLYAIIRTRHGDLIKGEIAGWKDGTISLNTKLAGSFDLEESNIASMIFKNGRFAYLSDLEVSKAEEYPFLRAVGFKAEDHLFRFQRDRAQGGKGIAMGEKQYAKGLGVHAISKLTFDPKGRYTRMLADIGIDLSAGEKASVEFSVLADGEPVDMVMRWTERGEAREERAKSSGVIKYGDPVRSIEVDVSGKQQVTLVVTEAGDSDINDRANWANAKFVR